MGRFAVVAILFTAAVSSGQAQHHKIADVVYARLGNDVLGLDLYLPTPSGAPLVVYVHGGAWRSGSKSSVMLDLFGGYAVASVDYRLSRTEKFPAQVHDIKAAIRFLRAEQPKYGYDSSRIAIAGVSAGAHLAALVGVTNRHPKLEGQVGEKPGSSSDVAAIVSLFGASN